MGKAVDGQQLPGGTTLDAQGTTSNAGGRNGYCCLGCSRLRKLVTFRCVFALVLGVGVLLSAVFWLPFFHFGEHRDLDLDGYAGHDIVASFVLKKPSSFLKDYILQLENDIFSEISFPSTKVEIISLQSSPGSNLTKVVFAVQSDVTTQSLIRENFMSLVTHQSLLRFTASLFGDPLSFEVLKFRGGITASPIDQRAFLMQSVQILFNFTLNFSIDEIINNFDELTSQLKTGLHLAPYENLYIRLTNLKGSTVDPPTTVQSQVLLAVGINPSKSRLKQLAQTITGSHAKNLGLNNTVFGRVKQVRLSSVLQHSLNGDGSPSPSPSPSPSLSSPSSPSPSLSPKSKFHHPHKPKLSPSVSPSPSSGKSAIGKGSPVSTPVPAPAPHRIKPAKPPPCHFPHHGHYHMAPSPVYAPHTAPSMPKHTDYSTPKISPVPAESPLPSHAHSQLPPQSEYHHARPPDVMQLISPSLPPSSAGTFSYDIWALPLLLLLVMHL